ncbi:hypothetical protein BH23CHL8_BH23CHL8_27330 [soil metagenome]
MESASSALTRSQLPWDSRRGSLSCPDCPGHSVGSEDGRYEVVLEGVGLHALDDHHDAVRVTRRAPGLCSGPFDIAALPGGVPLVAVLDRLERQTFDADDARDLAGRLADRFPGATVHVWPIGPDVLDHVAGDAFWDPDQGVLVRSPGGDFAPEEHPLDVAWPDEPEHVEGPGGVVELWRGCLYVDPSSERLVRHGWSGLGGGEPADRAT